SGGAVADAPTMSGALSAVFRFPPVLNQAAPTGAAAARAAELLLGFDGVLAVLDRRVRSGLVPRERLERDADAALPDGTLDVEAIERALARARVSSARATSAPPTRCAGSSPAAACSSSDPPP